MTTSTEIPTTTPFEKRQTDGWGCAVGYVVIPFYGLYYLISRRTLTPLLYSLGVISIAFVFAAIAVGMTDGEGLGEKQAKVWGQLLGIGAGIPLVKAGIEKSKKEPRK